MEPMLRFKADDGSEFPEWEEKMLGEEGQFYGGLSGKGKEDFDCGNGRFVTYMNVYKNTFASRDAMGRVKVGDAEKQNKVRYGDILFTQSSETVDEVGLSSVYLYDDEPYLNSFCMGYRFNNLDNVCPEFIGYCMRSNEIRKSIMLMGQGISRINLGAKRLATVKYKIPSLSEQRKIADLLSAVDAVIATQQAEVDAWEQRKKGVMQKLFSQEVRFKADDGSDFPKWEEKTLGEYCTQLKASIDPRKSPNTIFAEYSMPAFDESRKARFVSGREMNSARKILSEPCVLVNKLNVRKRRIWLVKNPEQNAVCSSEFVPLSSNAINLTFLSYFALTDRFTSYLMDCSSGSSNSQKRVVPDVILNYVMQIPSLPEQRKIADCLASMDEVIQKSKDELAKWQELKKGLLQQMFM